MSTTKIRAEQTNLIDTIYPVGSIYMSVSSTNPGTTFGVGTWTAWGEGRVPVGVAGSGTFNTVEKTGGAETHTLTTAEMPEHTHTQNSHSHRTDSSSTSNGDWLGLTGGGEGGWGLASGTNNNIYHLELTSTTATNQNTGGGGSHNNLQPYITCYMWKRTA